MRILEVIAIFQKAAGTSVFCGEVSRRLNEVGDVEVVVAVPDPQTLGMYEIGPGTRIMSIDDATKGGERWDVVHIHGVWSPILHRVANWAKGANIPIVWSPHGMLRRRALMMKWWKKLVGLAAYQWWDLRKASVLHVCSEVERRDVERLHLGVPFITVPLGVDIAHASLGPREGIKTVLYVGRINRGKGLMNLVNAWSMVRADGWRVIIAGFDEEGCEAELRARVKELGMEGDFEFPGPVYGVAKERLMAASDLFVLPSLSENFGSVVIESLAQQTPVIATRETPWDELPRSGCGWWVDVGVEPLAEVLKEAISLSDEERQAMGAKGRKLVEEKYTWDAVVKMMIEGYKTVYSGSC